MTRDEALNYAEIASKNHFTSPLYKDAHVLLPHEIAEFIQHWVRWVYSQCNPMTTEWLGKLKYNLTDAKILVDFFRQIGFKVRILNNKYLESYGERIYMEFERTED